MVQIYHAVFMSLLDDASREVEKHRTASCEGWAPQAHTGADATLSPASQPARNENTAGGAPCYPSDSTGGASAGAPRHRADRGTARDEPAGRFRRLKRPRTVQNRASLA